MKIKHSTALALSLAALTLTACAGGPAGETGDEITSDTVVEITDQQGSVAGYTGAAEDAEILRCETDGAGWVSEGTVTNPEATAQEYRIYVAFNENRDTKALVQVDVETVEPGATAQWQAEAAVNHSDLDCMLRVERFDPQN